MNEQAWDAQAATAVDARRAVWAEDDWEAGQQLCLERLAGMPTSGNLLDLGAGVGRLTIPMALERPKASLWAVDVSRRMLGHLSLWAKTRGVDNIRTRHTRGRELPVEMPARFDGAWSVLTFQHIEPATQERYFGQVTDRLKPGAPLVVQFVPGADVGPLSHPTPLADITNWCDVYGLRLDEVVFEARFPTWCWLMATKQ